MPSLRPLLCLSLALPSSLGLSLPQGPTAGCTWWKTITGPGRLQFSAVLTGSENYLHPKPTFCCDSELRSPVIFPGGFPGGSDIRKSAYKRDPDLIPVLGRSSWRMEWLPTGSPDYGSCNARHVKNTQSKVKHLRCSKSQTTSPHLTAEILHVACLVIYLF